MSVMSSVLFASPVNCRSVQKTWSTTLAAGACGSAAKRSTSVFLSLVPPNRFDSKFAASVRPSVKAMIMSPGLRWKMPIG